MSVNYNPGEIFLVSLGSIVMVGGILIYSTRELLHDLYEIYGMHEDPLIDKPAKDLVYVRW